jgi:hypothetical protein
MRLDASETRPCQIRKAGTVFRTVRVNVWYMKSRNDHLIRRTRRKRGAACSGNLNREAQTGMANGKRVPAIIKTGSQTS